MFDYSLAHWSTFFTAVVLLTLAPGPDLAFILGQTARGGRRAGLAAMVGIWSGAFVHVVMAALGLSAILATSALAFAVVKWAGAIYLFVLGFQALRSKDSGGSAWAGPTAAAPASAAAVYRQGAIVAMLNPKTAVFFLAFLPQFVVPGAGPTSAQLFLHGSLIIAVAACIEPPLMLLGASLRHALAKNASLGAWLDRGLGALFIGLGLRLALSDGD